MLKGKMSLVGLVAQFAYLLLLSLRDEPEFVLQSRINLLWVWFRFRLRKTVGLVSGSGSKQYLSTVFQQQKMCTKSCLFYIRSSIVSQKVGSLFIF